MHYRLKLMKSVLGLAFLVAAWGCGADESEISAPLKRLRVSVLPDQDPERLKLRNAELINYLADELGIEVALVPAASYAELLSLFHDHQTDLVFFGGVTFVISDLEHGLTPLVAREQDRRFTSYILVQADSPAQQMNDLKGVKLAFGAELSTSGHYMPRLFLEEQGLIPEIFFSEIKYSGRHDRTAFWVRDGEVDAGAANAQVIDSMFTEGLLSSDEVRILWETPPYADYVWAVHTHMSDGDRIRIQDAFLALDPRDANHKMILDTLKTRHFVPAAGQDYDELAQIGLDDLAFKR